MKHLALASMFTAVLAASQADCGARKGGGKTVKAIQQFCSNTGIMAPSTYADNGVEIKTHRVRIVSNCDPPQWVPQYWCEKQFYDICASAPQEGPSNSGKYGRNGCQVFEVAGVA